MIQEIATTSKNVPVFSGLKENLNYLLSLFFDGRRLEDKDDLITFFDFGY